MFSSVGPSLELSVIRSDSQRSKHHSHNFLTVQIWPLLSDPSDIQSNDLILKLLDPDMELDNEDVSKQA